MDAGPSDAHHHPTLTVLGEAATDRVTVDGLQSRPRDRNLSDEASGEVVSVARSSELATAQHAPASPTLYALP